MKQLEIFRTTLPKSLGVTELVLKIAFMESVLKVQIIVVFVILDGQAQVVRWIVAVMGILHALFQK